MEERGSQLWTSTLIVRTLLRCGRPLSWTSTLIVRKTINKYVMSVAFAIK